MWKRNHSPENVGNGCDGDGALIAEAAAVVVAAEVVEVVVVALAAKAVEAARSDT